VDDHFTITDVNGLQMVLIDALDNDSDPDGHNFGIISVDGATIDFGNGVEQEIELDILQFSGGTFGNFFY